jgi:predicted DNA-binding protein
MIGRMTTLSIKLPLSLEQDLLQISEQVHLSKSELVRRALVAYIGQMKSSKPFVSALDQAGDLVGCFAGGPDDLASNPRHLDGFGGV